MRPIHLKIAAIGILTLAMLLLARRMGAYPPCKDNASLNTRTSSRVIPDSTHSRRPTPGLPKPYTDAREDTLSGSTGQSTSQNSAESFPDRKTITSGVASDSNPVALRIAEAGHSSTTHVKQLPAIQLAENSKLPAAIMALGSPSQLTTPTVEVACRAMADAFYLDLAQKVGGKSATDDSPVDSMQEEPTTVINPGPDLDEAIYRSNELYRTLFGNDAYNGHSMNSAIEVMLPSDTDHLMK